jgi:hypothetical protein
MQVKTRTTILVASLGWILSSCGEEQKPEANKSLKDSLARKPRQGDVRDAHGCLTSAGYVWSRAKDSCIHLWEAGAELEPVDKSELIVTAVVSDDKMKAEIFVPDDSSFLLAGTGDGSYSNDSVTLVVRNNIYELKKQGKTIYRTAAPETEEAAQPRRRKRRR